MVHLVFFSPGNLGDPVLQTEAGQAALIGCLRSLLQNCLLLDFMDYRFDDEAKKLAEVLPDSVRKLVETLLAQFKKRNRIVRAAQDDYRNRSDLELLAEQAIRLGLELVIVRTQEEWDEAATGVSRTSVTTYALSAFEAERSESVAVRHFTDGEMAGDDFIRQHLVPFLRFSERLETIDGTLGKHFRDDYGYTLDRLFAAIAKWCLMNDPQVTVHCLRGKGQKPAHVENTIGDLAQKHGLSGKVRIQFYGQPERPVKFKHDRCVVSDIGVVNVGRGFDFIEKASRKLKNTTLGFGGPDTSAMLGPYAALKS